MMLIDVGCLAGGSSIFAGLVCDRYGALTQRVERCSAPTAGMDFALEPAKNFVFFPSKMDFVFSLLRRFPGSFFSPRHELPGKVWRCWEVMGCHGPLTETTGGRNGMRSSSPNNA